MHLGTRHKRIKFSIAVPWHAWQRQDVSLNQGIWQRDRAGHSALFRHVVLEGRNGLEEPLHVRIIEADLEADTNAGVDGFADQLQAGRTDCRTRLRVCLPPSRHALPRKWCITNADEVATKLLRQFEAGLCPRARGAGAREVCDEAPGEGEVVAVLGRPWLEGAPRRCARGLVGELGGRVGLYLCQRGMDIVQCEHAELLPSAPAHLRQRRRLVVVLRLLQTEELGVVQRLGDGGLELLGREVEGGEEAC
mmetsp:Transcript_62201/g.157110  ORF Transcript_62201/g.157110 Transcript_62201/m.157110 type:complete len:250 (-) Transcript_62201:499-1248(-)